MEKRKINIERKSDFKILRDNPELIYLNSGATSLKPDVVIDHLTSLYKDRPTYMGRGFELAEEDKDNEDLFFEALDKVANHINANPKCVIPTYGSTDFLNKVAYKLILGLNDGDEIILGRLEHASNILPWVHIIKELKKDIKIVWYDLKDWTIDLEKLKDIVNENTKVLSIAHFYNTTGAKNDLDAIRNIVGPNVKIVVDAAQAVGHTKIDVQEGNIDYYIFGGHKFFATCGIGMAYVRDLEQMELPFNYGGHMQKGYTEDTINYKDGRLKFIAGSQDVPGVIAFGTAIDYVDSIGVEEIEKHCIELQQYAMQELRKVPKLRIINEGIKSSNIFFEIQGVAGEDVAYHLYTKNILIRSGANCVKMENNLYKQTQALRISLHFFNTKEDIDKVVEELINGGDFIEALFRKRKPSKFCSKSN